jgi:hypothetical protein
MRLNTPGQADGTMSFWVDERPVLAQGGMHWRDVADLQLNKAWLQHYIAAGDATQSNRIWFDDVVVSRERIGCGSAAPTATPPTPPTPSGTVPVPSGTVPAPSDTPAPSPAPTSDGGTPTAGPPSPPPLHLPLAERR